MTSLNDTVLESNKYLKMNFDGGDLSSDAGLLLIKEFACKLGFIKLLKSEFKTNDNASFRYHKDDENLWQIIYQLLGAYFEDDCADELTNDPVLTAILAKNALASQFYKARVLGGCTGIFSIAKVLVDSIIITMHTASTLESICFVLLFILFLPLGSTNYFTEMRFKVPNHSRKFLFLL